MKKKRGKHGELEGQIASKVGAELRNLRIEKGLKQGHVADRIGVSQPFLSDLEHGRRRWSEVMIKSYRQVVEGK